MIQLQSKSLEIGTEVCLRLEELHPKGRMEIPNCIVNEIKDDGIYLYAPHIESRYMEGRNVELLWEDETSFHCMTTKINRCIHNPDTQLIIEPSDLLRSIDERRYFRLKHPINIEFRPLGSDSLFTCGEGIAIGGGGIQFISNFPLKQGQKVEILIEVPIFPYLDIQISGEVIMVKRFKDLEVTQIGVCFLEIDPMGKMRLFKYILDEQQPINFSEEKNAGFNYLFSLC